MKSTVRFDYLSKFGVDPIFAVGYIAIFMILPVWLEMPNHAPFFVGSWGFEPLKIVGRHQNPQKAHPWVSTCHLSHKRSKSVHVFELCSIARKKV